MACAKALGLDELRNIEKALMAGASEVDRNRREPGGEVGNLSRGPWDPWVVLKLGGT